MIHCLANVTRLAINNNQNCCKLKFQLIKETFMNTHHITKSFFRFTRIVAAIAITTASLLLTFIGSPTLPAYAAPGDCSSVNPMGADNARTVQSVNNNGRMIELRTGYLPGGQYGWARIANPGGGDLVWMDFSQDGGFIWKQCGPYTANSRQFSEAVKTSRDAKRVFRACGTAGSAPTKCTPWF
jgi:hypothetical protein